MEQIAVLLKDKFRDVVSKPVNGNWVRNNRYDNYIIKYAGQSKHRVCPHEAHRPGLWDKVRANGFAVVVSLSGKVSYMCGSNGCKKTGEAMVTRIGSVTGMATVGMCIRADLTYDNCFREGTDRPCTRAFYDDVMKHNILIILEHLAMGKTHQAEAYMRERKRICDEKGTAYRALYLTHRTSLAKDLWRRFKKGDEEIQKARDVLLLGDTDMMPAEEVAALKVLAKKAKHR